MLVTRKAAAAVSSIVALVFFGTSTAAAFPLAEEIDALAGSSVEDTFGLSQYTIAVVAIAHEQLQSGAPASTANAVLTLAQESFLLGGCLECWPYDGTVRATFALAKSAAKDPAETMLAYCISQDPACVAAPATWAEEWATTEGLDVFAEFVKRRTFQASEQAASTTSLLIDVIDN